MSVPSVAAVPRAREMPSGAEPLRSAPIAEGVKRRYLEGCGLSRDQARANVAAVVVAGGPAALCVSDKPELERLFLDFASDGREQRGGRDD